jgi:hypothetical protein
MNVRPSASAEVSGIDGSDGTQVPGVPPPLPLADASLTPI